MSVLEYIAEILSNIQYLLLLSLALLSWFRNRTVKALFFIVYFEIKLSTNPFITDDFLHPDYTIIVSLSIIMVKYIRKILFMDHRVV